MLFQPWEEAVWMVYMPTRHEHTLVSHGNVLAANCASGRLQLALTGLLLAMLGFNLYLGKLTNSGFTSFILFLAICCLLFRHSTYHFKEVVIIAKEVGVKV